MRDITNSKGKIFRHFKGDLYLVEDFVKAFRNSRKHGSLSRIIW